MNLKNQKWNYQKKLEKFPMNSSRCASLCSIDVKRDALEWKKKALWTFAAISFITPVLASILIFIFQGKETTFNDHQLSLVLLTFSAILLFCSFISVFRAVAIRGRVDLYIHAVIGEHTGNFKDYDKKTHAQGLLYCTVRNTALNDHIALFVKNAQILLVLAASCFAVGAVFLGLLNAHSMCP